MITTCLVIGFQPLHTQLKVQKVDANLTVQRRFQRNRTALPQGIETQKISVDGVEREFNVYFPKTKDARPRPVIFAFHGHGGNMNYSVQKFKFYETVPNAISVYMNGLPTPGRTDPDGKKNGWQNKVGELGDRDLKFFSQVLNWVKSKAIIDEGNIFSMGHSNGAGFTMALWNANPSLFKGLGVCSGGGIARAANKPTAFFAQSGQNDPIVPFRGQSASVNQVKKVNKSQGDGKSWQPNSTRWEGAAPVVWYVTDGKHDLPEEALGQLTKFFVELIGR
jgi:polyhydroxybutyrate depolymerase